MAWGAKRGIGKVVTNIHRNALWQHIATRIRLRLSDLNRDRSQLGVEPTRLIRIVCGHHHHQPGKAHSKGVRASRPVDQRAGNSNKGRTTRPHARTNAEKQEENRRTELKEVTTQPRDTFLASTCVRSPVPATWERSVRRSVDRCH